MNLFTILAQTTEILSFFFELRLPIFEGNFFLRRNSGTRQAHMLTTTATNTGQTSGGRVDDCESLCVFFSKDRSSLHEPHVMCAGASSLCNISWWLVRTHRSSNTDACDGGLDGQGMQMTNGLVRAFSVHFASSSLLRRRLHFRRASGMVVPPMWTVVCSSSRSTCALLPSFDQPSSPNGFGRVHSYRVAATVFVWHP